MTKEGFDVTASQLRNSDIWIDVGTPETYWLALSQTYQHFKSGK